MDDKKYNSVNKQTEEIKRWYELMINLQARMNTPKPKDLSDFH